MPKFLDSQINSTQNKLMGRGRKRKTQKMKNRKRQAAKKARSKRCRESVRKSRLR